MGAPQTQTSISAEVAKMVQSGTEPGVLKAFIQSWTVPFSLSAEEILHLHDVGVPSDVLTDMIRRSAQLQAQTTPLPAPPGQGMPDLVTTNPPAMLYPYPANPSLTAPPDYPYAAAPSYSYPAYTFSYLYPYSPYVGYPYFAARLWYPWPYYGFYGYPRPFGFYRSFPEFRHVYPGHSFGWGPGGPRGRGWYGRGHR